MARVLGLNLELSTRLDAVNVGLVEHWHDPRCDDIHYEEDDVRQNSGVSSEGGFEGDGCPCHAELMDSLPVETGVVTTATESPSDSFRVGTRSSEFSETGPVQDSSVQFRHFAGPGLRSALKVVDGARLPRRRVTFSFEVAFWFPSFEQFGLSTNSAGNRLFPHVGKALYSPKPESPNHPACYQFSSAKQRVEGGSCRSFPAAAALPCQPVARVPVHLEGGSRQTFDDKQGESSGRGHHAKEARFAPNIILVPSTADCLEAALLPASGSQPPQHVVTGPSDDPHADTTGGQRGYHAAGPHFVVPPGLSDGWQYFAVFDVVQHVRVLRVALDAGMPGIVAEALRATYYLPAPVSFRIMQHVLPDLPQIQLTVWTEPNPGFRVIPVKIGSASYAVCTVNVPVDCPPFELASQVSISCEGLDRLRYHVAEGAQVVLADGHYTTPFVPGQLAGADCCSVCDAIATTQVGLSQLAALVTPQFLTQERFATRSSEIVVHRHERRTVLVNVQGDYGPQQVLTRLLGALGLPGTGRMSCTAISPVDPPCRLHVVVHPGNWRYMQRVPCLVDLRRVALPPTSSYIVVHFLPSCTMHDVLEAVRDQCPSTLPIAAAYVNLQLAGARPTVITLMGTFPDPEHDSVVVPGYYMPRVLRGSDTAALRPGFARFLAAPATVESGTTSTTTGQGCHTPGSEPVTLTTTQAPATTFGSPPRGARRPLVLGPTVPGVYTVFEVQRQVQQRHRAAAWDPYHCLADAVASSEVNIPYGRCLRFQVEGLPGPPLRAFLLDFTLTQEHAWCAALWSHTSLTCAADGSPTAVSQPLAEDVDLVSLQVSGQITSAGSLSDTIPIPGLPQVAGANAEAHGGQEPGTQADANTSSATDPGSERVTADAATVVSGRHEAEFFALFDEFHHLRLIPLPRGALPRHLVALSFALTPQLDHPREHRFLQHLVPGLPDIQLCVWGGLQPTQVVIPFLTQEPTWPFCTTRVGRQDSAFDAALAVEEHCGFGPLLHEGLQQRQVQVTVDGHPVRPHARHVFRTADYAGFQVGPFPVRGEVTLPDDWSPYAPAAIPVEARSAVSDEPSGTEIVLHRPEAEPLHDVAPTARTAGCLPG